MPVHSAGLLFYRRRHGAVEVFLVHHGGPYWAKKDAGAWSIPKGEFGPEEGAVQAARREFHEETGFDVGDAELLPLGEVRQASGKVVHAWAAEGDYDAGAIRSNRILIEWPPRSGRKREFPEVDRAAWFSLGEAKRRIVQGQVPLIDMLAARLGIGAS